MRKNGITKFLGCAAKAGQLFTVQFSSGSCQAKIRLSLGICHYVDSEAFQSFPMNTVVGISTIFVLGTNNLLSNNTLYSLGSLQAQQQLVAGAAVGVPFYLERSGLYKAYYTASSSHPWPSVMADFRSHSSVVRPSPHASSLLLFITAIVCFRILYQTERLFSFVTCSFVLFRVISKQMKS